MLGLGLGLQFGNKIFGSLGRLYLKLANADGGSGGSATCVDETVKSLLDITS